ncbi:NAD-dependent histone deacetylase SIR2 [Smittium mucronatum]|uniref:NAD-dependent histone deacetylase SIR2 n=1 Tax=Smittium mucronatum TaxID=133383 RepID=A0A1R0GUT0_9FUNG|nr:NAD-dependent histone deacetylase SIR2 [Smittium mucronatum]
MSSPVKDHHMPSSHTFHAHPAPQILDIDPAFPHPHKKQKIESPVISPKNFDISTENAVLGLLEDLDSCNEIKASVLLAEELLSPSDDIINPQDLNSQDLNSEFLIVSEPDIPSQNHSLDFQNDPMPLINKFEQFKPNLRIVTSESEKNTIQQDARKLGLDAFLMKYIIQKNYSVVSLLNVFEQKLFFNVDDSLDTQFLPLLKISVKKFIQKRPKLPQINSIEDALFLIRRAKRIMVLTGAGVSVSCGIPDFRSSKGIYQHLAREFGLDDPQQMFDIDYFMENPELFYSFAKQLYPDNFKPSPSHVFIKLLEDRCKLLRNYTQNIDTLEHVTGIHKVLNCHGSFASATCVRCGYKCQGEDIRDAVMNLRVPYCPRCNSPDYVHDPTSVHSPKSHLDHKPDDVASSTPSKPSSHTTSDTKPLTSTAESHSPLLDKTESQFKNENNRLSPKSQSRKNRSKNIHINKYYSDSDSDDPHASDYGYESVQGVLKPDIVFFGENLPSIFHSSLQEDRTQVDLLIVMGSSLKVAPVSEIMGHLPPNIPQIVINKTPITHLNFDIQLIGDSDDIVTYLCYRLGWNLCHPRILGGSSLSDEYMLNLLLPFSKSGDSQSDKENYTKVIESSQPDPNPIQGPTLFITSGSEKENNKPLPFSSNLTHLHNPSGPTSFPADLPGPSALLNEAGSGDESEGSYQSSGNESYSESEDDDEIPVENGKDDSSNGIDLKSSKKKDQNSDLSGKEHTGSGDSSGSDSDSSSGDSYNPLDKETKRPKLSVLASGFKTRRSNDGNIYNMIPNNWHLFKGCMLTSDDIEDYYHNSGSTPSYFSRGSQPRVNGTSDTANTISTSTNPQSTVGISKSTSNDVFNKSAGSSIPSSFQLAQNDIDEAFDLSYSTDSSEE